MQKSLADELFLLTRQTAARKIAVDNHITFLEFEFEELLRDYAQRFSTPYCSIILTNIYTDNLSAVPEFKVLFMRMARNFTNLTKDKTPTSDEYNDIGQALVKYFSSKELRVEHVERSTLLQFNWDKIIPKNNANCGNTGPTGPTGITGQRINTGPSA
jgi:hypothetical protein